jgi:hypothetical protein
VGSQELRHQALGIARIPEEHRAPIATRHARRQHAGALLVWLLQQDFQPYPQGFFKGRKNCRQEEAIVNNLKNYLDYIIMFKNFQQSRLVYNLLK